MNEREALAREVAGDNYGLSIEPGKFGSREYEKGRLFPMEREAFDAGWEAAKQYYTERHARIAEAMCPTGGRLWTDEQNACFSALTDCAENIRTGNPDVQNIAEALAR